MAAVAEPHAHHTPSPASMDPAKKVTRDHATLLNHVAPSQLGRCTTAQNVPEAMKEAVENLCYDKGRDYNTVMHLVDKQEFAILDAWFDVKTTLPTSPLSAAGSSRSAFGGRPEPKMNGLGSPVPMITPPRTTSQPDCSSAEASSRKPEMGHVYRSCGNGVEQRVCSMLYSNTQLSFVSAELLNRFSDKPFGDPCAPVEVPHLDGIGPVWANRSITLAWSRNNRPTTHEDVFYILETLPTADLLPAAPPAEWNPTSGLCYPGI